MKRSVAFITKRNLFRTKGKSGQSLVEYSIIIAMMAIVCVILVRTLGTRTQMLYSTVNSRIDQANSSS